MSIVLPDYDSKDAVFFVLLLQGHTVNIDNLPELTGFQDAPQRAYRLRAMRLPTQDFKRAIPPKYANPVAFYSLDKSFINEVGKERAEAFIKQVSKAFSHDAKVKKGLQSKPQPLKAILSGDGNHD